MTGDIHNRRFIGKCATCGCRWTRDKFKHIGIHGDVLVECETHQRITENDVAIFERRNPKKADSYVPEWAIPLDEE